MHSGFTKLHCVISQDEICAVLGSTPQSGNSRPKFQVNLSIPYSRVENSGKNVG